MHCPYALLALNRKDCIFLINIDEAIIVEGKYDKIRLSGIVNAVIIPTNGFRIFKDRETLELIRHYATSTGIIIMTDSDSSGRKIRGFLKGSVSGGRIINVHIPDVFGKERRKVKPSAEGKLGVEGMDEQVILDALSRAGITAGSRRIKPEITRLRLYQLGLSGRENSAALRERLLASLGLPSGISSSAMLEVLNTMLTDAELTEAVSQLQ